MIMHDPVATTIWRLLLLPYGEDPPDRERVVAFCHARSVLGMGWSVDADQDKNISKEELNENFRRWKEEVKIGDLVWTRTPNREYLLARVTGEWRSETAPEFKAVGMVNIREVEFVFVGKESNVPVRVVNSFIPNRTLQRIRNVDNLSCYLWNKYCLSTSPKYRFDILCLDRDEVISFIKSHESHLDALPPAIADDYMRWQTLRDRG